MQEEVKVRKERKKKKNRVQPQYELYSSYIISHSVMWSLKGSQAVIAWFRHSPEMESCSATVWCDPQRGHNMWQILPDLERVLMQPQCDVTHEPDPNEWCCKHKGFTGWHLTTPLRHAAITLGHSWKFKWAAHCVEYILDFISDKMMNWARMDGAAATRPAQIDILYNPSAYAADIWVIAEGLSELLTVLNICLI
jgi:hypothetical protein